MPKIIFFDLDGTLAESKQAITPPIPALITNLLERTPVAIISGGALQQFILQVVQKLPANANFANLYLLPTSGAALYARKNDEWNKIYEENLSVNDMDKIEAAMRAAGKETDIIDFSKKAFGEYIERRGGEVSLSALGQHAHIALKKEWDPSKIKRRTLQAAVSTRLPDFSVAIGGATTIDVTKKGVDKAYGVRQLCRLLNISEPDALYVGDELEKSGNDEAVFKTSVQTRSVTSPADTAHFIISLLEN